LFLKANERVLLFAICVIAIARVFLFSAAFPFFNNVDELAHFDTVVKYSHGWLPRLDSINYDRESAEFIAPYASPEYLSQAQEFIPSPLWHFRDDPVYDVVVGQRVVEWVAIQNHEALSPPIYYALAGVWYDIGKFLRMSGAHLLYWVRFLNIPLYAVLLWFTYLLCRHTFADDPASRISAVFLVAVFPQDVFYSINSDVLSPVFCLISFYCITQILRREQPAWFYLSAGSGIAAAFLVKFSNLPVLLVLFFLMFTHIKRLLREDKLQKQVPNLTLLALSAAMPIVWWLGRNSIVLHDITGTAGKILHLGWKVKPFSEMLQHPLFTLPGLTHFISELVRTFWRGEFVWRLKLIALPVADNIYIATSCAFIALSFFWTLTQKGNDEQASRQIIGTSLFMLVLSVLLLAILSIMYDFGACWYPSRSQPYFTSGRLILGALIPFVILYVNGVRYLLIRFQRKYFLIAVMLIGLVTLVSEIVATSQVFYSDYNWFHLFSQ